MRALLLATALAGCSHATAPAKTTPSMPVPPAAIAGLRCSEAPAGSAITGIYVRGTQQRGVCSGLSVRAGARPTDDALDGDLRSLYATGLFEDVRVVVEQDTAIVFEVVDRTLVERVDIVGAPAGTQLAVNNKLELAYLDRAVIAMLRGRMAESLVADGYRSATVDTRVSDGAKGRKIVTFTVTPGARTVLSAVRLVGLTPARDAAVRKVIGSALGKPVDDARAAQDEIEIQLILFEEGLFDARVAHHVEPSKTDPANLELVFDVTEGAVYKLGTVKVSGKRAKDAKLYAKAIAALKKNDVARRSKLVAAREAIEAVHTGEDPPVNVTPETNIDTDKHIIDLDYVVE